MILVLMLVLAALTSLLAASNLERTQQRTLLSDALVIRAQMDEVLMHTLHQGLAYANNRLRIEDFNASRRGIYKTVDTERSKSDYRRSARPAQSSVSGMDTGFWIEMFSESPIVHTTSGKFYSSCKLLISAYAEAPDSSLLFSQALVETSLPTLSTPTSDTSVVKVETLPEAKVIAIRTFN